MAGMCDVKSYSYCLASEGIMAHAGPVIEPEPMRQTLGTAGNKSLLGYRYDLGIPGAAPRPPRPPSAGSQLGRTQLRARGSE